MRAGPLVAGLLFAAAAVTPRAAPGTTLRVEVTLVSRRLPPAFSLTVGGEPARLTYVEVLDLDRRRQVCKMILAPESLVYPVPRWTYGESIWGFSRVGCGPLSPGKYTLTVHAEGGVGYRDFEVTRSADVLGSPGG